MLLNLQRAVQAVIDIAAHIVAVKSYGLPDSVAATFTMLEAQGIVDAVLASRLRGMAEFRNIVVHNYQALDPSIVDAIVARHLDDLRQFCARVVQRFKV